VSTAAIEHRQVGFLRISRSGWSRRTDFQVGTREEDKFLPQSVELLLGRSGFEQSSCDSSHGALQHRSYELRVFRERFTRASQHFNNRLVDPYSDLLHDLYSVHVGAHGIESDTRFRIPHLGIEECGDESCRHLPESELIDAVHDNLRNLALDRLDVVNLRVGGVSEPTEGSIEEPLTVLAELKRHGVIRHLGLSNVTRAQLAEAQKITEIVCVQNFYNVAQRNDDSFIDELAKQGIAYVPFFPLGGFTPLQSSALDAIAASLGATPMQVALAWLLRRSPNVLLIPGTSSIEHLRENLKAAALQLPPEMIAELNKIGGSPRQAATGAGSTGSGR
jgi:diketogulonate reductase-like aldo/keto reductase